ncbi:MAG TPA: NnrS family protein, partial [Candidatus Binatia bacterium]
WIFHGMTQVQGFLLCFAIGFLFTMIPRRTGSAPPSTMEMIAGIAAPVSTVIAAWLQKWAMSQLGWVLACGLLLRFAVVRARRAPALRRPPASFVWIPVALLVGLCGSVMTGVGASRGPSGMWLHQLGQQLVLQGVFTSLVVGVGGFLLPMITRGQGPGPSGAKGELAAVTLHLVAAAILVASFFVQQLGSIREGCALRAAVVAAELLFGAQLWRLPSVPGWNRRLVWIAAWMLPTGFAAAALWPDYYEAGLHVSFVGGFATLSLAVGTHVVLAHGGKGDLVSGQPWQVGAIALLMGAALVSRVAMTVQAAHRNAWMATAAVFFLAATAVWMGFLLPIVAGRLTGERQT